jgi:preprotein translocase subunit SecD
LRAWPIFLLLTSLMGCDALIGKGTVIEVATPGASLGEADKRPLASRLAEYGDSYSPNMRVSIKQDVATITGNGLPSDELIHFLIEHRGVLIAADETGKVWFENGDITDASATPGDNGGASINISLTESAGNRVSDLSESHVGRVVLIRFDDEVLTRAVVKGKFGRRLLIATSENPMKAKLIASILRYGPLSTPVQVTHIQRLNTQVSR